MSKELEALKRIRQETCPATYMQDFDKEECCNIIEKGLKRLEIMDRCVTRENKDEWLECHYITKEEYELL